MGKTLTHFSTDEGLVAPGAKALYCDIQRQRNDGCGAYFREREGANTVLADRLKK